jgi:hypothetical protein
MTGVAPLPQRGLKPEAPRGFAGRLIERVGRAFDR